MLEKGRYDSHGEIDKTSAENEASLNPGTPQSGLDVKDNGKHPKNFAESLADTEKQLFDINETEPPDQGLRAWLVVLGVSSNISL